MIAAYIAAVGFTHYVLLLYREKAHFLKEKVHCIKKYFFCVHIFFIFLSTFLSLEVGAGTPAKMGKQRNLKKYHLGGTNEVEVEPESPKRKCCGLPKKFS